MYKIHDKRQYKSRIEYFFKVMSVCSSILPTIDVQQSHLESSIKIRMQCLLWAIMIFASNHILTKREWSPFSVIIGLALTHIKKKKLLKPLTYQSGGVCLTLGLNDLLLFFLFCTLHPELCTLCFLCSNLSKKRNLAVRTNYVTQKRKKNKFFITKMQTCFASTAAAYSLPKVSSVIATSSSTMLKSCARSINCLRTNIDTC